MMILVLTKLFSKNFSGMAIFPFILLKERAYILDKVLINHEKIHLRQQLEMGILPFFIWYGIEYLIRWIQYKDGYKAYKNISFEREAYSNEENLDYLSHRNFWTFCKYLKKTK